MSSRPTHTLTFGFSGEDNDSFCASACSLCSLSFIDDHQLLVWLDFHLDMTTMQVGLLSLESFILKLEIITFTNLRGK